MTTRREFFRLAAQSATSALLAGSHIAGAEQNEAHRLTPRRARPLLDLQQRFVDLRFGMFVHFNMATFQDREWGDPTSPPDLFHPTALDTDQWAMAARSANMTWGCLTTRHHDGFCIWPTKTAAASVGQTSHSTDAVRAYVNSFRRAGLRVGLYYSILSLRDDIRHFNITPAKVKLIKDQLTELLTDYGEVDILITDGWDAPWSRITYEEVPFQEIYEHIKNLQPDCLLCDLNASQYPSGGLYYSDVKAFEQNAGQKVPEDSDVPALSCVTLTDGWFWKQRDANGRLKAVTTVVDAWLEPLNHRHCNLILNAPPNREGRLAPNVVSLRGRGRSGGTGGIVSEAPGPRRPRQPQRTFSPPGERPRGAAPKPHPPDHPRSMLESMSSVIGTYRARTHVGFGISECSLCNGPNTTQ